LDIIRLFLLIVICMYTGRSSAQELQTDPVPISHGITVTGGIGHYAVRDEYISDEKYSGNMPSWSLGWSSPHGTHSYFLDLRYCGSTEIENYTI